jgi:hypothetical protein
MKVKAKQPRNVHARTNALVTVSLTETEVFAIRNALIEEHSRLFAAHINSEYAFLVRDLRQAFKEITLTV